MSENNTRSDNVGNKEIRFELGKIGNVLISYGWKNDQAILILNNGGLKEQQIKIRYMETSVCPWREFKTLQLPYGNERIVELHKEFEKWENLRFDIGRERGRISVANLKKRMDDAKQQAKIERPPPKNSGPLTEVPTKLVDEDQNQQFSHLQSQFSKLEQIATKLKTELENLKKQSTERARENSELKAMLDTQATPISEEMEQVFYKAANHVLQMTFAEQEQTDGKIFRDPSRMCEMIKTELDKFKERLGEQENHTLSAVYQQLAKAEALIRFKASEMPSSEKIWENKARKLAELVFVDEPPNGMPFFYPEEIDDTYWEDLRTYRLKLPQALVEVQSILYQTPILLMDGFSLSRAHNSEEAETVRSFYENYLPNILEIMGLELVPIEIGQTDADARIHDIQDTRRGAFKPGVVVDIIQHGVRRTSDQKIIKKPVVMRGEPE